MDDASGGGGTTTTAVVGIGVPSFILVFFFVCSTIECYEYYRC